MQQQVKHIAEQCKRSQLDGCGCMQQVQQAQQAQFFGICLQLHSCCTSQSSGYDLISPPQTWSKQFCHLLLTRYNRFHHESTQRCFVQSHPCIEASLDAANQHKRGTTAACRAEQHMQTYAQACVQTIRKPMAFMLLSACP